MVAPTLTHCAAPGATLTRSPRVNEAAFGDGYVHRTTTGINIMRDAYAVTFPGDDAVLTEIDLFLSANAVRGFWWSVDEGGPAAFYVCDEWRLTYSDRNRARGKLGTVSATFRRVYNEQPA